MMKMIMIMNILIMKVGMIMKRLTIMIIIKKLMTKIR